MVGATDICRSEYPELCFGEGVWRESVNRGDQHFIPQDLPLLDNGGIVSNSGQIFGFRV